MKVQLIFKEIVSQDFGGLFSFKFLYTGNFFIFNFTAFINALS